MSRVLISAAHKSSGKTTITVGLCAALSAQGLSVQPFKKGPDYIDPMWLGQASGRPCFNLDPFLMSHEQIISCFSSHALTADISIVEGNKGLYDGLALDGSNSNAALAHLLDLPVILVLDARGMTRGIAPLILGYQAFDPRIRIAGVILNQLGGSRHESKLRAVIEHYTDVTVLGAIAHDQRLEVVERHLGLMPNHEIDDAANRVRSIGEIIAAQVDLPSVLHVAADVSAMHAQPVGASNTPSLDARTHTAMGTGQPEPIRIGVARDKAFGFYYPDDLAALAQAGVEIVPFNTLKDAALPDVDGVLIGGGFPEMFMPELQSNVALRENVRMAIQAGLPVYAECGGLMYLARTIQWNDKIFDMVGSLPVDVVMHDRPVGRGYVELETTDEMPWRSANVNANSVSPSAMAQIASFAQPPGSTLVSKAVVSLEPTHTSNHLPHSAAAGDSSTTVRQALRGHEFHYSSLKNAAPELKFAYRMLRGHGVDGHHDGIVYRNVLASYTHLRSGAGSAWVTDFVSHVRALKAAATVSHVSARDTSYSLTVNDKTVVTDSEGYLKNLADWSEDFAVAQAKVESLDLTDKHWQVITFLRTYYEEHRVQAQVRAMIWHFTDLWNAHDHINHFLHELFPQGGPQKQGNRLAGLMKTKGEH